MARIQQLADHTPAHRERHIDLLRAVAITAVVLGHWLVVVVERDPAGQLTGYSALAEFSWAHPISWVFQVMPVFFMVGGYANAASLTSYRQRHGDALGWLRERSSRLVLPTAAFLLVLAMAAVCARALGAAPDQIGTAAWLASLPLWFLVVYLAMITLTPGMHALHRRAGWAVPVVLLALVVVGDGSRFWSGSEVPGWGNFLFAWLAIHQLGFFWYDRRLPTGRRALPLAGLGAASLVLLTVPGPYPISMVTVPGADMQNSSPPTLALMALAATQLGCALAIRGPTERWLRRSRSWLVVVGMNAVILTVFLWHMSAVVLLALLLNGWGALPTPPAGSGRWLWWQIPWVLLLMVLLAGLVAAFGRVETTAAARRSPATPPPRRAGDRRERTAVAGTAIATVLGYVAALMGLLWIASAGDNDHGPFGLPTGALVVFFSGALLLWLVRGRQPRPAPATR